MLSQPKRDVVQIIDAAHDNHKRWNLATEYYFRILSGISVTTKTSGSTGIPKSITHCAEDLKENAETFIDFVGLGPETRMLHVMKINHMAGQLNTILCPLLAGGAVIIGDEFSPTTALTFWRTVIDNHVNSFWLAPGMARAIFELDRSFESVDYAKAEMKFCFVGTAALDGDLYEAWQGKYGVPLLQSYGMSEIMLASTNTPQDNRQNSVGKLLPGVMATINDDSELIVTTPFVKHFHTGDRAWMDEFGHLYIGGRVK